MQMRNGAWSVFRREIASYFQSPLAYIFITIFVIATNSFTLFFSRLLENGEASLHGFFGWHPWLYTMLIPAITMRLWSEEKRLGTIELLHTLPLSTWQLVIGKFMAAWLFTTLAVLCTLPMWWSIAYLGNPDHGLIIAGYIGSILMAGAYVAIGAAISSANSSHVIAFIMGVAVCMLFTIAGSALGNGLLEPFLPKSIVDALSQFGFASNYNDIIEGFVEWRSIFYFFSIIAFGLWLNRLFLLTTLGNNTYALFSLPVLLSVICFFCVNLLANIWFSGKQFDFTEEKSFTLSENTKNILATLEEPLYVTLYYSEEQAKGRPAIQSYAHRVKALLKDYAYLSDGMVKLNILNPTPFSDAEQRALKHTITGAVVDNLDNKLYFGLTVSNSVDHNKVIPHLDPSRKAFLEYDITRILYQLSKNTRPNIGVLSWLPMRRGMTNTMPQPENPWVILRQMESLFNVEYFHFYSTYMHEKLKNAELDIMMVVHPFDLDDKTARFIHDYVVGGGKAIFFVDGYQDNRQVKSKYSDLNKIFKAWGISSTAAHVVADQDYATHITKQEKKDLDRDYTNITWLSIPDAGLNDNEVITSHLTSLQLPASSALTYTAMTNNGTQWSPLIVSSKNASLVPAEHLDEETQIHALLDNFKSKNSYFTLAGRLSGTLPDFFADTRDKPLDIKPAEVIIVGDADMLRDDTWVRIMNTNKGTYLNRFSDNGAFALNALDYLTGAKDLISLRSRSQKKRYFTRIRDIQKQSESDYRAKEKEVEMDLERAVEQLRSLSKNENNSDSSLLGEGYRAGTSSLRDEIHSLQNELRVIRTALQAGIKTLSQQLIWLNVGVIPSLILMLAFIVPTRLRRRPHYAPRHKDRT